MRRMRWRNVWIMLGMIFASWALGGYGAIKLLHRAERGDGPPKASAAQPKEAKPAGKTVNEHFNPPDDGGGVPGCCANDELYNLKVQLLREDDQKRFKEQEQAKRDAHESAVRWSQLD